jgi:nucleotide-binding universal stress UspA family protein
MRKTILVGLDGSPCADAATELGIDWSRCTGAELVGMGVIDEPTICRPEPTGAWGGSYKRRRDETLLVEAGTKVGQFLKQFAARCREAGVPYREAEEVGVPAERLLAAAEDVNWTLLGQETRFRFATQKEECDTLRTVLRSCTRPVVVVPREAKQGTTVLIAYDASPASLRALHAFRTSGLDGRQPAHVLSAADDEGLAAQRAEEAARFLRFYDIKAEAHALPASAPEADLILRQAERHDARLIVLGAFGRSRLSEAFSGSTTLSVLRRSERVLFCHH